MASTSASPMAAMLHATMIWLASLVTLPAPTGPVSVTLDPIICRIGRTFSKTSGFAAHHDGQRAVDGLRLAAAHRRIQELDALGRARRADLLRHQRADGAHVHHDGAGAARLPARRRGRAPRASTSGPSGSMVMTISERAATSCADAPLRRARRHQFVDRRRHDVEHHQRVPGLQQVPRHGLAHDAQDR